MFSLIILTLACSSGFVEKDGTDSDTDTSTQSNEPSSEPSQEPGQEPANEPSQEPDPNEVDNDGDGFTENQGDCDDQNPNVNPFEDEVPYDMLDNDCDPSTPDDDLDGDGWGYHEGDCMDQEPLVNPGADDSNCNEFDDDCDGVPDDEWDSDDYESNDTWNDAHNFGELDDFESTTIEAYNYPDGDTDYYVLYANDGWGWGFGFTIDLTDIPSAANLGIRVYYAEDLQTEPQELDVEDTASLGDDEHLEVNGNWFGSDTGYYYVEIFNTTPPSCRNTYTLSISE